MSGDILRTGSSLDPLPPLGLKGNLLVYIDEERSSCFFVAFAVNANPVDESNPSGTPGNIGVNIRVMVPVRNVPETVASAFLYVPVGGSTSAALGFPPVAEHQGGAATSGYEITVVAEPDNQVQGWHATSTSFQCTIVG